MHLNPQILTLAVLLSGGYDAAGSDVEKRVLKSDNSKAMKIKSSNHSKAGKGKSSKSCSVTPTVSQTYTISCIFIMIMSI